MQWQWWKANKGLFPRDMGLPYGGLGTWDLPLTWLKWSYQALQSNPAPFLLFSTGVRPASREGFPPPTVSPDVSPNTSLACLNSSWQLLLSQPTNTVLKQYLMNLVGPGSYCRQTTDPESEPRSLLPHSKAFSSPIMWEIRSWHLRPEGHCSDESEGKMAESHSCPPTSAYKYADSSGRENICPRFRENWSSGLGQQRKLA